MINYRFDEEKQILQYYASDLNNTAVQNIIKRGLVTTQEEALILSEFFWVMVDKSIENESAGISLPWVEGAEFWNEKIMTSISGHLESAGYENVWRLVSDRQ